MSYRITRLSPQSTNIRVAVQTQWSDLPLQSQGMQFWRSWLEFDSEQSDKPRPPSRVNWNAVFGLGLMVSISAGFWTGVGFLIAHLVG